MSALRKFLFSFVIFAAVCALGLKWYVNYEVGRELNRAVADVEGLELSYDDLSVSIFDPSVTLAGVAGRLPSGERFTAGSVRVTSFDQRNPVPHYATVEARGVRLLEAPSVAGWWPGCPSLSVDGPPLDLALDYRYDPASNKLEVKTARLDCPEVGSLDFNGTFSGLDLAEPRVERLIGLRIAKADLRFTEGSLLGSFLKDSARALGTSVDDFRARLCAELSAMADYAATQENPVAEDALRGIRRFVAEPGTVTIQARPGEPVPVPYFFMGRDMYDNLRLLGVSVTTDSSDNI
jgi:hypothetical protein